MSQQTFATKMTEREGWRQSRSKGSLELVYKTEAGSQHYSKSPASDTHQGGPLQIRLHSSRAALSNTVTSSMYHLNFN